MEDYIPLKRLLLSGVKNSPFVPEHYITQVDIDILLHLSITNAGRLSSPVVHPAVITRNIRHS